MGKFFAAEQIEVQAVERAGKERTGSPVIDLVHLSRQTLGDSELENELLILFDRQALQFAARLALPAAPGESGQRGDLAHTLKGSARAIGAFELGEAADAYEIAVRAGAPETEFALKRLQAAIDRAHKEIARLL
ncbi:Hpt domain-containing protein [Methylocystis heyeri]|uniref:Histidine phosphotransferase n=1 Tax=Methylocystis heyeri TaxID=391905 RepID=A0A6B8KKW1_9HYPH|nr:Hpt domain-containing protein [Methylocystis heyeri]QGM47565.1 histidine phosphotransferase [Methylocystis heyeri]